MQDADRLRRLEDLTDLPLLLLSVALVPLLVLPWVIDLSSGSETVVLVVDWLIWAFFAVDFAAKLAVAPCRLHYLRAHWIEAAMVLLPFLRPIRVLRVLRLARVAAALGFNLQLLREIASRRGTQFVVAAVMLILVSGALLTLVAERSDDTANITQFGDALWWAVTTMTTVGYGDHYPVTPMGRGVAVALMLFGVAALSALTATVAAYLVREREGEASLDDVLREVRALRIEISALREERERR